MHGDEKWPSKENINFNLQSRENCLFSFMIVREAEIAFSQNDFNWIEKNIQESPSSKLSSYKIFHD